VTRRLGLLPMSAAFWVTFAAGLGVLSASGHCISARWSVEPVCGADFWWIVVTSPEILIFMFFMITDPMTSPRDRGPRVVFGASVGLTSALLVAPMQTEFGAKVAVLAGLVVVCALRPPLAVLADRRRQRDPGSWPDLATGRRGRTVLAVGAAVVAVPALVLAGTPAREPVLPTTTVAVDAAALEARPDVPVAEGAVPDVAVSEEVQSVVGAGASQDAETMGRHLVEDLLIEADALRTDDATLAATALAGPRLDGVRRQVADDTAATPAEHAFAAMTLVVVRDPDDPQAVPQLGIHATGTRTVEDGSPTPFDQVFVMQEVGEVWLLTDELSAP
jgi:hypothetical protein